LTVSSGRGAIANPDWVKCLNSNQEFRPIGCGMIYPEATIENAGHWLKTNISGWVIRNAKMA
jgi:hypothetical protein